MNPNSIASYLFSLLKTEFLAPEFIKSEFNEHEMECLFKSKLSEHEFRIRQKEVEESIEFVKVSEYEKFIEKAVTLLSDRDDVDFLAVALSKNAAIWSNDLHLKKQSLVEVYTTNELISKLLKGSM